VLAVASGKGGVGKTSLVANLGAILARRGRSVMMLDADFGLANLDILLNLSPGKNLGHVFRGEAEAADVVIEVTSGLRVIPGATGIEALADLSDPQRRELLAALAPLSRGQDWTLVDAAAGIGRNVTALCRAAGEVVRVTDPEPASLTDAYGLVKVLWTQSADVSVRVVVNSVAGPNEGRNVHRKLDQVVGRFLGGEVGYLGHIVRDDHVGRAARRQVPFATAYPRSPASRCLEAIVDVILGAEPRAESPGRSFWHRLLAVGGGGQVPKAAAAK
jgi:flagellar biosynthesis protein FlhG